MVYPLSSKEEAQTTPLCERFEMKPVCFPFSQPIEGIHGIAFLANLEEGVPCPDVYQMDAQGHLVSARDFYPVDAHELRFNVVRFAKSAWASETFGLQSFYPTAIVFCRTSAEGDRDAWAHLIISNQSDAFPVTLFKSKQAMLDIPTEGLDKLASFPTSLLYPKEETLFTKS